MLIFFKKKVRTKLKTNDEYYDQIEYKNLIPTRGMILAWHMNFFQIKKSQNDTDMIGVWHVYIFLNKKIKKITKWHKTITVHIPLTILTVLAKRTKLKNWRILKPNWKKNKNITTLKKSNKNWTKSLFKYKYLYIYECWVSKSATVNLELKNWY